MITSMYLTKARLLLVGILGSQCSIAFPLPVGDFGVSAFSSVFDGKASSSPEPKLAPSSRELPAGRSFVASIDEIHRRDESASALKTIEQAFRLTTVQPSESLSPIPEAPSNSSNTASPQYVVAADSASPSSPASSPNPGSDNKTPSPSSGSDKCGPDEAAIVITNESDHDICYMVELSAQSNRVKDITVACGPGNGFTVPAGKGGREFCPGNNFVGALTAFHQRKDKFLSAHPSRSSIPDAEKGRGTRFEFTYQDSETWYDVDYEMGIDSSTLSPASSADAKVGEKDIVRKVDKAYQDLSDKEKSDIKDSGYVDVDKDGKVKDVRMDKAAPDSVVNFLQLKAGLTGYVNPGSVEGEKDDRKARLGAEGVAMADRQTKKTGEKRLLITSY